jgi:hypothetical protein
MFKSNVNSQHIYYTVCSFETASRVNLKDSSLFQFTLQNQCSLVILEDNNVKKKKYTSFQMNSLYNSD